MMDEAVCRSVLQLPESFTLEQLKAQYRALALELHPDKKKFSAEESGSRFRALTACYKQLLEAHSGGGRRGHAELKAAAGGGGGGAKSSYVAPPPEPGFNPNQKFDVERFNDVFDKTRQATAYDSGYSQWNEERNGLGEKLSRGQNTNKHIQVYKEPEAVGCLGMQQLSYDELGVDRVKDFSGDNASFRDLNFTDYRLAHSTDRIIPDDEEAILAQRPQYATLEALKSARESPQALLMSAEQREMHAHVQRKSELRETRRQQTLRQQELNMEERHNAQRRLMFAPQQQR